ncbi:MAG: hypothetical protein J6C07_10645 [Lachnospiraceae bacterium]|nr:hypothetical protein [Lachnospiraceae bacterium]
MKKTKFFAVVMAAVMTLSMVACGEQTGNDVTPTTAPTTAPTEAPADPTATPVPAPQNVTIAGASVTFEDGNMGFVAPYMQHATSANLELSIVDYNGSKALKVVNTNGKTPWLAIDVSSLLGANVAKLASVDMVVGTSRDDGEFYATSGQILSWFGTDLAEGNLGNWSVYMEKKNPKVVTGTVAAGNELIADATNILLINLKTDNGKDETGAPATLYIDDITFMDAAGNVLTADTTVAFNEPAGFSGGDGPDLSNLYAVGGAVAFDGFACSGSGWGQNGAEMPQELIDALVPGSVVEISYTSEDGSMWIVMPDATVGWTRVAQGAAYINNSATTAQITYEQLAAALGEDKATWGARMQFEAQTNWEVYGIKVGTATERIGVANAVAFDGFACSGSGWGQNGAEMPQELIDALVPGSVVKISYTSEDGSMWIVMPDAAAGWSRCAQGTAVCDGSTAYITYEQIAAVCGEDKSTWGARMQFEAVTNWEVYGIEVGTAVKYPVISGLTAFDGFACSGTGWGQNGAEMPQELIDKLVPGAVIEISFQSEDNSMWIVMPDAAAGWSRCAQGTASIADGKAYITYEQIAAVCGEDKSTWGARMQFEAVTNWEVFGIRVGQGLIAAAGEAEEKKDAPDPTIQVADGTVAHTGTLTMADSAWWTQKDLLTPEVIGDVDPATITAIKFTSDTTFVLGYTDTVKADWAQFDSSNTYVVKTMDFNKEEGQTLAVLALSKGDGVEYTINWEVYTGGSTDIIVPEEPAEPVIDPTNDTIEGTVAFTNSLTFADSTWWTQMNLYQADLIGDLDPAVVKGIKFTCPDTNFVLGYTNVETGAWDQFDSSSTYVAKAINFVKEKAEDPVVCLALSKGDGVEYTITWEVYTDGGAAAEAPAEDLVIKFADLTAGGYGYEAAVNGDAVDVTIASQYQEIQYILPEVVDLAAYKTLIVDVTSNVQLDIKLVDPNAELNQYSQKTPFKDNYTAQDQGITEAIYIDLAEFADKDLAQINFMTCVDNAAFTIKSITFVK